MKSKNTLNILNGQIMYNHFLESEFLKGEIMIPFNEAMCYGDTTSEIFSDEFIIKRAKVHHVTSTQYKKITLQPLQSLFNQTFEHLVLWFDDDMFCQINILTILAWLDQIDHLYPIKINLVDDHFEPVETFTLKALGYHEMYNQVLLNKINPKKIQPSPLKKGIKRYLSYLDQDSDLMIFIQKHKDKTEKELLAMLLKKFSHYGLGDTQYLTLIHKNRNSPYSED